MWERSVDENTLLKNEHVTTGAVIMFQVARSGILLVVPPSLGHVARRGESYAQTDLHVMAGSVRRKHMKQKIVNTGTSIKLTLTWTNVTQN